MSLSFYRWICVFIFVWLGFFFIIKRYELAVIKNLQSGFYCLIQLRVHLGRHTTK